MRCPLGVTVGDWHGAELADTTTQLPWINVGWKEVDFVLKAHLVDFQRDFFNFNWKIHLVFEVPHEFLQHTSPEEKKEGPEIPDLHKILLLQGVFNP